MLNTILTNLARSILTKVKTYSEATFVKSANLDANVAAAGYVKTADLPAGQDLSGYALAASVSSQFDFTSYSISLKADQQAVADEFALKAAAIATKADDSVVVALAASVAEKASAADLTALSAIVTGLSQDAPETLNTFAEVAAAIQQGATDLGLAGLDQTAISAIVDAEWAALP
jgi:hypothetical protein